MPGSSLSLAHFFIILFLLLLLLYIIIILALNNILINILLRMLSECKAQKYLYSVSS